MQKIVVIALGKIKESFYKEVINKYEKLLVRYSNFEIIEIDSLKVDDNYEKILEKEALKIQKVIDTISNKLIIVLDENGQNFTSVEFSKEIEKIINFESKNIVFIIGSAFGLSNSIKKIANLKLALSKMTFTHEMIRVFFLEQLYRSFKIMKNEEYHK